MKPNTNEQATSPELDPRASRRLNEMTIFCMSVFKPPVDLIAQIVMKYDNLDERNNSIMMTCFARALMLTGKTIQDVEAIMKDPDNCQKYIDAFMESIDFMMFIKDQVGEDKENANQIIRH